jgi:hypothetical protein
VRRQPMEKGVKRHHASLRLAAAVIVLAALGVGLYAGSSLAGGGQPANVAVGKQVNGPTKCFTVTIRDGSGALVDGYVSITLAQSSNGHAQGHSYGLSTDGTYNLCYGNGSLPQASDVTAFADTNENGVQDAGEPDVSLTAQ